MTSLPKLSDLPTDNLYKFMALSGVALTIFSCVFPLWMEFSTWEKMDPLRIDIAVMQVEVENFKKNISNIDFNNLSADQEKDLGQKTESLSLKNAEIGAKLGILKYYSFRSTLILILMFVPAFLSIFLANAGFVRWYNKLQKYQDEIIETEAKLKLKQLNSMAKDK